jgi:hypothetical protein
MPDVTLLLQHGIVYGAILSLPMVLAFFGAAYLQSIPYEMEGGENLAILWMWESQPLALGCRLGVKGARRECRALCFTRKSATFARVVSALRKACYFVEALATSALVRAISRRRGGTRNRGS